MLRHLDPQGTLRVISRYSGRTWYRAHTGMLYSVQSTPFGDCKRYVITLFPFCDLFSWSMEYFEASPLLGLRSTGAQTLLATLQCDGRWQLARDTPVNHETKLVAERGVSASSVTRGAANIFLGPSEPNRSNESQVGSGSDL